MVLCVGFPAHALQVTGYSAEANDRFVSGYPSSPVLNPSSLFVGAGRNWSGVGWSASNTKQSFVFLSPRHYLVARHFGGAGEIRVIDNFGVLRSGFVATAIENTNYGTVVGEATVGDTALATTTSDVPNLPRYGVLDLNSSSTANSPGNYNGLPALVYGHWGRNAPDGGSPRLASTPITGGAASGFTQYLLTSRTDAQLEDWDSGSPLFAAWTNPNNQPETAILGNHAAITDTVNVHNWISTAETINALNGFMVDEGRAVRVVGNPSRTWEGDQSSNISSGANWGLGLVSSGPIDLFTLFHGATATRRSVTVNAATNHRGIYFRSASGANPFTFSGSSVLTVGRGGITNYDADTQVISAPLRLGDHQFWSAGPGGLQVASLDTNGRLVEISAPGLPVGITGNVSGSGGLAVDQGQVVMSGTSSMTGSLWVHSGELRVNGQVVSAQRVRVQAEGKLTGSGRVSLIEGGGSVEPGTGAGILTADRMDPVGGLDFHFEFTALEPVFSNSTASGNDVLRLAGSLPFVSAMGSSNRVAIYLNAGAPQAGQVYAGGFFTDESADFLSQIGTATVEVYVADAGGGVVHGGVNYSLYNGPLPVELGTRDQTADFGSGAVNGRVMTLQFLNDPAKYAGWAENAFPAEVSEADRLPDADPNGDGVTNFAAYAFVIDPMVTANGKLPFAEVQTGAQGLELVFRFRRNTQAGDVTYIVETSPNLVQWSVESTPPQVINPDVDGTGLAELVEVRIPLPEGTGGLFARVVLQ